MNAPAAFEPATQAAAATARALPWRVLAQSPVQAAQWDDLAAHLAEPNPFYERWFLEPSLAAFDPAGRVELLVVERGGALIGLLPLVREWRYAGKPIPHWAGWTHPNLFLGAPLVRAGAEGAFWQAVLAHVDAHAGAALFLHVPALPLDGPLAQSLHAVAMHQHRQVALVWREDRAMLQSALSPEDYHAAALPGKKRKELRRQRNRLAEQGDLTVERRDDASGIAEWTAEFLDLEARGWKGKAGSALAMADGTRTLFTAALAGAAARGRLERLALRLDGRPVAMLATLLAAPGAFSFKTAFDEHFARFSPGVLLQTENLAMLARPGIGWTDSCAAADHPMIDSLWMERRAVGRLSVAIGGRVRRALFARLAALEVARARIG